jgi:hypothetical protein
VWPAVSQRKEEAMLAKEGSLVKILSKDLGSVESCPLPSPPSPLSGSQKTCEWSLEGVSGRENDLQLVQKVEGVLVFLKSTRCHLRGALRFVFRQYVSLKEM